MARLRKPTSERSRTDPRLQLRAPDMGVAAPELSCSADDFERTFFEAVLRRDPCYEEALQMLGYLYTEQGEYAQGLAIDHRLVRLHGDDATAWYNLACSHALLHNIDDAIHALTHAVDLGWTDVEAMETDHDLDAVRHDRRYHALCRRMHETAT